MGLFDVPSITRHSFAKGLEILKNPKIINTFSPPSLLQLSLLKTAIAICNHEIIKKMFQQLKKYLIPEEDNFLQRDAVLKSIKGIGREHVLVLKIPKSVQAILIAVFDRRIDEIYIWYLRHRDCLCSDFDEASSFYWTSEGTIDRLKTAQQIVQRNDANEILRFKMASVYCLETDLESIWRQAMESTKDSPLRTLYHLRQNSSFDNDYFSHRCSAARLFNDEIQLSEDLESIRWSQWQIYWFDKFCGRSIPCRGLNHSFLLFPRNKGQLLYCLKLFESESREREILRAATRCLSDIEMLRFCLPRLNEYDLHRMSMI
ncbi:hypothetical protein CDAR_93491 [Caerostris darwini]|uniref:Uncharacterized protein n=1 Tax=Caerostris darwini TaxID=1538125 RepID=A0AAV4Q7H0_9ARAC|nr:hypothetical protein CDAR_93491 [Caerostris darwini]